MDFAGPVRTVEFERIANQVLKKLTQPDSVAHDSWKIIIGHRRATDQQIRELMEFTSGHLASVLAKFRPWEQISGHPLQWPDNMAGIYISPYFSPRNWILALSSRFFVANTIAAIPFGCSIQ